MERQPLLRVARAQWIMPASCIAALLVVAGALSPSQAPRHIRVSDSEGNVVVAREYGDPRHKMAMMPDGQIVFFNQPVYTDDAFRPETSDELIQRLSSTTYKDFQVKKTKHYVVFYQCSQRFAEASATLLENLYTGLLDRMRKMGFDVHDAEFPLIAGIYADEESFRSRRDVSPDVLAYYEVISNRIFFFEQSARQREDPMFDAMRKPQTVAHEGTHQVLNNIGIQSRLADWPPWLVEGLAELAASGSENSREGEWVGFSKVNQLHIATLDDLEDDLAQQSGQTRGRVGAPWGRSMVDYMIRRDELNPTDYALAWTLTHFLANERRDGFITYLKALGRRSPDEKRDTAADVELFQQHFGKELIANDALVGKHVAKLRKKSTLMYYAVVFQQALPGNFLRRGTLVSRSPQVIREWVEQRMPDPRGGTYHWQAVPFRSKQQAFFYTEQWLASEP